MKDHSPTLQERLDHYRRILEEAHIDINIAERRAATIMQSIQSVKRLAYEEGVNLK